MIIISDMIGKNILIQNNLNSALLRLEIAEDLVKQYYIDCYIFLLNKNEQLVFDAICSYVTCKIFVSSGSMV